MCKKLGNNLRQKKMAVNHALNRKQTVNRGKNYGKTRTNKTLWK